MGQESENYYYTKELYEPAQKLLEAICTPEFLKDLFDNLAKVFGANNVPCIFTDDAYEVDGEEYQDVITGQGPIFDFFSSTGGWAIALDATFDLHPEHRAEYNSFYSKMDWMDSDVFDGELEAFLDKWYRENAYGK